MDSDRSDPPARLHDLDIVVVDDDPRVRDVLALMLEGEGARAHAAQSAREALAICASTGPAAVLTDLRMPGEDGVWLLTRLRALLPGVRVIAMSGLDEETGARYAGFDGFLAKPLTTDRLCRAVRTVIGGG